MFEFNKTTFYNAVYEVVRRVPYGRATSYGAIARAIGFPNMSRMVGRAMKECDDYTTNLPAYRIVNSQGVLSGKDGFESAGKMKQLLEAENIQVENNRIKNWKQVFWNPLSEIRIG